MTQNQEHIDKIALKFGTTTERAARILRKLNVAEFVDEDYEMMLTHFCNRGEIPYEVVTSGDAFQWIFDHLTEELGNE